jgi:UDP-glucose 4-epimerase
MPEHHFITGLAGFIGSHLADALLSNGYAVSGLDDFSLGRPANLARAAQSDGFHIETADAREPSATARAMQSAIARFGPITKVWHLAANSDIAAGVADSTIDFGRTLQTTFSVIQACKSLNIRNVAFASTSAIYGEIDKVLEEDTGPLLPISTYGATKLASEALLSAAAESVLDQIWIFRFPNVVGSRATHGALYDFVKRLADQPASLRVLGDGSQWKPYLHVSELVDAMRFIVTNAGDKRNVFNIGPDGDGTLVKFLAEETIARVSPGARIDYTGGDRGWVGDVPRFSYSTAKLARLGWQPSLSSNAAAKRAIDEIATENGF